MNVCAVRQESSLRQELVHRRPRAKMTRNLSEMLKIFNSGLIGCLGCLCSVTVMEAFAPDLSRTHFTGPVAYNSRSTLLIRRLPIFSEFATQTTDIH